MIKKFPWALSKALKLLKLLCHTALKTLWLQLRLGVATYGLADLSDNNSNLLENHVFFPPKLRNKFISLNVYMGYCLLTACSRTKNIFLSPSLYSYLNGVWPGHGKKMQTETQLQHTGYKTGKSLVRFQRFGSTLTTSLAEHFVRSKNLIMLLWVFQVLKQDFLYFTSRYMLYHQTQLAKRLNGKLSREINFVALLILNWKIWE